MILFNTMAILLVVLVAAVLYMDWLRAGEYKVERSEWARERKELMDRIQAPSFAEYKTQEVRLVKAKNGVEEHTVTIEQL